MNESQIKVATQKNYGASLLQKVFVKNIALSFGFTLLALIIPAILAHTPHNQWITGILVNLIIFLAAAKIKTVGSLLPATIPSLIAATRGLLPIPLVPMIPFIILGNIVLAFIFSKLFSKNQLGAVIISAVSKSIIIAGASALFFHLPQPIATIMQWPQLITALTGGLLALAVLKVIPSSTQKTSYDQQA
jgi:hypothetical protein